MIQNKPKNEGRRKLIEKIKILDKKNGENLNSSDVNDDEKLVESARSDNKFIPIEKSNNQLKSKSKKADILNKNEENGEINKSSNSQTVKETKTIKKPPRRARKIIEKNETKQDIEDFDTNLNILGIIIHQTDKLRTDINIYNPIVRIHLLDLETDGQYLKKTKRDRNTLIYYEKENRKLDYISPISTSPYDFKKNRTIIPRWEELIVFNEDFSHFTKENPNVLLMFELIDFRFQNDSLENFKYTSQETNKNWQRIGWAFLKIRSINNSLNIEKKMRLQLFYTQEKYKFNTIESMVPEVYNLYKNGPRVKYPASLHVTIKSIIQPKNFMPGVGSSDFIFNEGLNLNQIGSNKSLRDDIEISQTNIKREENLELIKNNKQVIWSRINGLPCRVPNELHLKLNSSKGGCYSVKFSNTGNFLACACVDDDSNYPILVYTITEGDIFAKFNGHFGLVYEISWSKSDKYMATASNDATARIFDIESKSKEPFKILPHPSFLYTVKFFPDSLDIVVTGGYDKVLRIWSIDNPKKNNQKYGELLQELYAHNGYINTTCFSNNANTFYSADSIGEIKAWNCYPEKINGWTLKEEIHVQELKNETINFIQLLPNQFRMLVQMKDNQLNVIDIRIKSIIQNFKGLSNANQSLRSCVSPCGTFLFNSGSDTNIYCWNINTGDQLEKINVNFLKPVRDMDFHPYDNYLVFCSHDFNAPVLIYKHNPEKIFNYTDKFGQSEIETIGFVKSKKDEPLDENEIENKLKSDIYKLKDAENNIWKMVNDKLDSVYPRSSKGKNGIWSKNNYSGYLTMTVVDSNVKPEFKYRGPKEVEDIVICLYDYKAQRGDELDLKIGDEILVLVRENENWWLGELTKTKQEGYFPAAYVQEKTAFEAPKKNIVSNNRIPKYIGKDISSNFDRVIEPIPFMLMPQSSKNEPENSVKDTILERSSINKSSKDKNDVSSKTLPEKINTEINIINEIPTKDENNFSSQRRNHKRKAFAHVIKGPQ